MNLDKNSYAMYENGMYEKFDDSIDPKLFNGLDIDNITVELDMADGNQLISPQKENSYLNKITIIKPPTLLPENIKKDVSIGGVVGEYTVGAGYIPAYIIEDDDLSTVSCTASKIRPYAFYQCSSLTAVNFPVCTSIGSYAFAGCSSLTSANLPVCTSIGDYAFYQCSSLTEANFPACTTIGDYAFRACYSLTNINFPACSYIGSNAFASCSSLTDANFPACTSIGSSAFSGCSSLTEANFPVCSYIGQSAFYQCNSLTSVSFPVCTYIVNSAFAFCNSLKSLYLTGSSICILANINAFSYTPMTNTGNIYVPSSLLAQYQTATNWSIYSSRFVGI